MDGWPYFRDPGRARKSIVKRLMPDILISLTAADAPDDKFAAPAQFIEGLPASVQIFSLLDHNRDLTGFYANAIAISATWQSAAQTSNII